MGVVYKAEDTKLDRPVALKFLAPHLLRDEEGRKRFEREAKAAAKLDHPNICTAYEIDKAGGQTFIAMAFLEGPPADLSDVERYRQTYVGPDEERLCRHHDFEGFVDMNSLLDIARLSGKRFPYAKISSVFGCFKKGYNLFKNHGRPKIQIGLCSLALFARPRFDCAS